MLLSSSIPQVYFPFVPPLNESSHKMGLNSSCRNSRESFTSLGTGSQRIDQLKTKLGMDFVCTCWGVVTQVSHEESKVIGSKVEGLINPSGSEAKSEV